MKDKRRRIFIGSINSDRGVLDSVAEVKEEVFNHFASKFKETNSNRPTIEGEFGSRLSQYCRCSLEASFLDEENKAGGLWV